MYHIGQSDDAVLSLIYLSTPNGSQTARKQFANQMCICVGGTANLRCAVCEQLAYHSLRTEICRFFVGTQRELDAPGVLSMHRVSFARLRFAEN